MQNDVNNLAAFARLVLQIIEECDRRMNAPDNDSCGWDEPCLDAYGKIINAARSRALIPELR